MLKNYGIFFILIHFNYICKFEHEWYHIKEKIQHATTIAI